METGQKEAKELPRAVNQEEIDLIKRSLDEPILRIVRTLFLGFDVTKEEKEIVKTTFKGAEIRAVMWRRFYPQLDVSTPIGQVQDIWLGAEQLVYGYSPDTIYQAIRYKQLAIDMIKVSLRLLEDPYGPLVDTAFVPPVGPASDRDVALQVQLLARNMYVRLVEQQLLTLLLTTQLKVESPKEGKIRREKDSNK